MAKEIDKQGMATVGKTPQGAVVPETPSVVPTTRQSIWGVWGNWLGDPDTRYGRRQNSRDAIPMSIKLEMLADPVIAMCLGFMASKLANAKYEIRCVDEKKRRFFQAMYERVHRELMLQIAPAIALGGMGLIKKFRFEVPRPLDPEEPPVWESGATPFILTGFEQVYPRGAAPKFNQKTGKFEGITCSTGEVDVFYALWLTIGKAFAFGDYMGRGRLVQAYGDWWLKQFSRDLFVVHLQKNIDRVVKVGHPPGTAEDGKTYSEHARLIGDRVRAGATVSVPTEQYTYVDQQTGDTKHSGVPKWTIDFLPGAENVGAFHEMDDHFDQKISLAMFLPPQAYLNVKQSALGGPTTADVLGELAVDLLLQDAIEVDVHLNEYVFPIIDHANFLPGSPPVEKWTTGLVEKDRRELIELIKALWSRAYGDQTPETVFDERRALERLGMPIRSNGQAGSVFGGFSLGSGVPVAMATDGSAVVPVEVLESIAKERLPDDADEAAEITDEDIARVLAELRRDLPEIFEQETA